MEALWGCAATATLGVVCSVWPKGSKSNSDGFAAVDALVALTILASAISLTIEAVGSARRAAQAALETERAKGLLEQLLESGQGGAGVRTGRSDGFDWRLEVAFAPADPRAPALVMCTRKARLTGVRSRRGYALSALDFCARPAGRS